ncbi:MAG: NAD-dependent epimerase/dehydratase family protein [Bacteroidia bacterium]|nr:NAD-dependent epimerase/dehydratase family protein [Bacteroidia bacterium]MCX7651621.1 NAD-dependent epimerase/dehydratase family protein [Bacteroidia bacterium]MDW8417294.1 NAD-dependent epimerase/dehydratase family protein [Bacteroidia bacterium]
MRVLITGAGGQIGHALVPALVARGDEVIATDIRALDYPTATAQLDILDKDNLRRLLHEWKPQEVYHLAAYLSARSEREPHLGWEINFRATWQVFEACKEAGVERVFWASSIAAFGPHTPRQATPQYPHMDPVGLYGIAKLAGERIAEYFFIRHGLDIRSLRFPGVVGPGHIPQGGTTDFAVHMFYAALREKHYTCYLLPDTTLPMLYIDDAIEAILQLMATPKERLSVRGAYNIHGMSFSPAQLEAEIQKRVPEFYCTYEPDFRQKLAESWPESIDDTYARRDWGWQPKYDLSTMAQAMWEALSQVPYESP